jgi:hypothetical protein
MGDKKVGCKGLCAQGRSDGGGSGSGSGGSSGLGKHLRPDAARLQSGAV